MIIYEWIWEYDVLFTGMPELYEMWFDGFSSMLGARGIRVPLPSCGLVVVVLYVMHHIFPSPGRRSKGFCFILF